MEKRKIPLKNYLIFASLAIFSFILVFNLSKWYRDTNKYDTVLNGIIVEVLPSDLENYLTENGNILIYVTSTEDETLEEFENDFKNYLIDKEMENLVVYYDYVKDENNFSDFFNEKLLYPNIYNVKEHTLERKLYDEAEIVIMEDVASFIETVEAVE